MNAPHILLEEVIVSDESGFACSKTKLVADGLIHLRPFNLTDDGALSFNELYRVPVAEAPSGKRKLEAGDILFNNTNSAELVGKAAMIEQPIEAGYSNHLTRIRVNQERVAPMFMSYWLRWMRGTGHFSAHATQWVSQAAFKSSELRRLKMPLPALPEQRRIVDILSRAEGIVRLQREAQKKAAEIIPALFLDLFGDPATNPKGWPIASIGDVIAAADYGSSQKASDTADGLPLIRMGNVTYEGNLDLSNLKYVELAPEEVNRYRLQEGDILFNRTNSKELVGKTGLWNGSLDAVAASYFIRVRVRNKVLTPIYLWAFMNTTYMKRVLFETARGAIGQANINARELRAFRIPLPHLHTQQHFETLCQSVFSIHSQQTAALQKAEATFNSLLALTLVSSSC